MKFLYIFCFLFLLSITNIFGLRQKGELKKDNQNWSFLAKFCYSNGGLGTFSFTAKSDTNSEVLAFYNDSVWNHVWGNKHKLTCQEKLEYSRGRTTVRISPDPQVIEFRDSAPHFWYIVAANCDLKPHEGLNLTYDALMLNPGNEWERQFSYDHQTLAQMFLFFWLVFFVCLNPVYFFGIWSAVYMRRRSYHPLLRLVGIIILTQTTALFCSFIHYIVFKDNGIGVPGLQGLGELLNYTSQILLYLFFVIVAMGYPVSKREIPNKKVLIALFSLISVTFIAMFIWGNVAVDPESTIYIYDTIPGIVLVLLVILTWLIFLWSLYKTINTESSNEKKKFYIIFGGIFSTWFLAFPFLVSIAALLPPWFRFRTVTGTYLSFVTLVMIALLFVTWPKRLTTLFLNQEIEQTDEDLLTDSSQKLSSESPLLKDSKTQNPTDHQLHHDEL